MNRENYSVTVFKTVTTSKKWGDMSLSKIVTEIKGNDGFKKITEKIQSLIEERGDGSLNKEKANKEKLDKLPIFLPCGRVKDGKKEENFIQESYNGIVVVDIDGLGLELLDKVKKSFISEPYTLLVFTSPSGYGLKVLIQTNNTNFKAHKLVYHYVVDKVEELFSEVFIVDRNHSIVVSTYACYDPNVYYNPNPVPFEVDVNALEKDDLRRRSERVSEFKTLGELQKPETADEISNIFTRAVKYTEAYQSFHIGNRHRFIVHLALTCHRAGMSEQDTLSELYSYVETDFPAKEIDSVVKNTFSKVVEKPIKLLDDKKNSVAKVAKLLQRNTSDSNYSMDTFGDLAATGADLDEPKKLFGAYIPEGAIVFFPSERGTGKTFFVMQLGLAISSGQAEFLGEDIELNGPVVLINFELGKRIMAQRAHQLLKNAPFEVKSENFKILTVSGKNLEEAIESYLEELHKINPVLIIIDNLRTAFIGEDNESNRKMTEVMTFLKNIRDDLGCSIVLVHHLRKGSIYKELNSDSQSGAGATSDLVDGDFMMRKVRNSKNRYMKRLKSRIFQESEHGKILEIGDNCWFKLVQDGVKESDIKESTMTKKEKVFQAIDLTKKGLSQKEIAEQLEVDKSTVSRWMKDKESEN